MFAKNLFYFFQIREFILAVVDYTGSKVDIIAYSMGTAISRKAILGGNCVDTNEDLGPPITDLVDTFIAVGGVANGLENCWPWWPACNLVNGMICSSNYLVSYHLSLLFFESNFVLFFYSRKTSTLSTTAMKGQPPTLSTVWPTQLLARSAATSSVPSSSMQIWRLWGTVWITVESFWERSISNTTFFITLSRPNMELDLYDILKFKALNCYCNLLINLPLFTSCTIFA